MLDLLGEFDFALPGEQRDHSHFAKVYTDRIVALVEGAGRKIDFSESVRIFIFLAEILVALKQLCWSSIQVDKQIVQVPRFTQILVNDLVHLVVESEILVVTVLHQQLSPIWCDRAREESSK